MNLHTKILELLSLRDITIITQHFLPINDTDGRILEFEYKLTNSVGNLSAIPIKVKQQFNNEKNGLFQFLS